MTVHDLLHQALSDGPAVRRVGLTLAHSVWQGAAAAAVAWALLVVVRRSARARYAVACGTMAATVVAAAVTFAVVGRATPARRAGPTPVVVPVASATIAIAAAPQPATPRPLSATAGLVLLWAAGVATQAAWQAVGWARVRRLGRSPAVTDARWTAALATAADRVGVRRAVRLLASAGVDVPVVLGAVRPAVVVPVSLLSGLPGDHIVAVLAHELAHVRRHDYLVNLVQCGIEAVMFYHPAVWWMSAVVRREREHCCDDAAAVALGSRPAVAAALVAVEERRGPRLAMAISGSPLAGRVRRLLAAERPARRQRTVGPGVMVGVVVVAVLASTWRPPTAKRAGAGPASRPVRPTSTESKPADVGTPASDPDDPQLRQLIRDRDSVAAEINALGRPRAVTPADGKDSSAMTLRKRQELFEATLAQINAAIAAQRAANRAAATRPVATAPTAGAVSPSPMPAATTAPSGPAAPADAWRLLGTPLHDDARPAYDPELQVLIDRRKLYTEQLRKHLENHETPGEMGVASLQENLDKLDAAIAARAKGRPAVDAGDPYTGVVYVGGNILRPGVYPIQAGHRTPVSRIVMSAGDVNVEAGQSAWVTVSRRIDGRQTTVVDGVPFAQLLDGTTADPDVQAGDVVRVSGVDPAVQRKVAAKAAADAAGAKLWDEKYAAQVVRVNGRAMNEEAVRAAWRREVDGSTTAATRP